MIKTIIFDFGNVFINLDIDGNTKRILDTLNINEFSDEINAFNAFYEQGLISTNEFIEFYTENFPKLTNDSLIEIWNSILKDFPTRRLDFLKTLKASGNYKLILLSNTNELHINWIKEHIPFYDDFKNCFDAFYLSHDINLRKPNNDIFEFVLNQNNINANECLFIDDIAANTNTAQQLGIHTWNINPDTEDVCDLLQVKTKLF